MFNIELIKGYFKHTLFAKTRHGIHSPFVYKLVDEVIYDFRANADYLNIEALRADLFKDERFITITDLGAGSHVNNNKQKQVKQLAKNALKPAKLAQLIYRVAKYFSPEAIIELGTCLGLTTSYLAVAAPQAKVTSIEGCPETAAVAAENLKKLGINNVDLMVGDFDSLFPEIIADTKKIDFVFIDGNHRKIATLNYFEQVLPKIHEGSVMIFDDIYWSKGMKEAWTQIKGHPQVTITIDLFWIGLVFFKKGMAKEHFKIKY
ncbi:MAG TPA: class I SAM-dependent methyltransferase [Sphingobacteriaceae bacterium]|nr:class I SAM-dependent methyltransferase [Sphingobacteriaceae bacterium]